MMQTVKTRYGYKQSRKEICSVDTEILVQTGNFKLTRARMWLRTDYSIQLIKKLKYEAGIEKAE